MLTCQGLWGTFSLKCPHYACPVDGATALHMQRARNELSGFTNKALNTGRKNWRMGTNWRMGMGRICSPFIICRNEFLKTVKWLKKKQKKKYLNSRHSSSVGKSASPSPLLPVFTASYWTDRFELHLSRHLFLLGGSGVGRGRDRQTTSRALSCRLHTALKSMLSHFPAVTENRGIFISWAREQANAGSCGSGGGLSLPTKQAAAVVFLSAFPESVRVFGQSVGLLSSL